MTNTLVKDSANRILQVNPSLSYAEVARLLGVTRQRIKQVAGRRRRYPRFCKVCGKRTRWLDKGVTQTAYHQGYCQDCWIAEKERRRKAHYLTFTCELCGAEFYRKAGTVRRQEELGQQTRWCSKYCQGKWLAANYRQNHAGCKL